MDTYMYMPTRQTHLARLFLDPDPARPYLGTPSTLSGELSLHIHASSSRFFLSFSRAFRFLSSASLSLCLLTSHSEISLSSSVVVSILNLPDSESPTPVLLLPLRSAPLYTTSSLSYTSTYCALVAYLPRLPALADRGGRHADTVSFGLPERVAFCLLLSKSESWCGDHSDELAPFGDCPYK